MRAWVGALRIVALAMVLGAFGCVLALAPRAVRTRVVSACAATLCRALGVTVRVTGRPRPQTLIVCNHVSWLDALVLAAAQPSMFIAKHEVRAWPVIGWLAHRGGTCFVRRESAFASYRCLPRVADSLADGCVALFPEGTTTSGHDCLALRGMFLEPAIRAGVPLQPVAVRYRDAVDAPARSAAFVGDDTFAASLWRVVTARSLAVELVWMPNVIADDRREAALRARAWIRIGLARVARRDDGAFASEHDGFAATALSLDRAAG